MRVERWFAFVDLSGFTSFGDQFGDDESVRVLTLFRGAVRQVATDFGVRIAKWLGDGCMLVSVDAAQLVADPHPQPLRRHRPPAGFLPEAQDVPYRASRPGLERPDPGHDQVELVRRVRWLWTIQSAI